MLTISEPMSAGHALKYFDLDNLLEPAEWAGDGAAERKLSGEAQPEPFKKMLEGYDPHGEAKLVQNAGAADRVACWSLAFGVPKSLSVLWSQAPAVMRIRIETMKKRAVLEALDYVQENCGYARSGKGGNTPERAKLTFLLAAEPANRANEPHLHTHALLFNLGIRAGGKTSSFHSRALFRHMMAIGAVYRASLAASLQRELGLALRRHGSSFEIAGIDQDLIDAFSSRRHQIEEEMERSGQRHPKAARIAALKTRPSKQNVHFPTRLKQWQEKAEGLGFRWEQAEALFGRYRPAVSIDIIAAKLVPDAIEKLLQSKSYFNERQLVRAVAEQSLHYGFTARQILAGVRAGLTAPGVVSLGKFRNDTAYTIEAVLQAERILGRLVEISRAVGSHVVDLGDVPQAWLHSSKINQFLGKPTDLTKQQLDAVVQLLNRTGSIQLLASVAGGGRTKTLEAATQVWRQTGFQVLKLSFSQNTLQVRLTSITGQLQTHRTTLDLNTPPETLPAEPFRQLNSDFVWGQANERVQIPNSDLRVDRRTVLVVDNAERLSTVQLQWVVSLAAAAGAKLILAGNHWFHRQNDPETPLKAMAEKLGAAALTEVQRQRESWKKEVILHLAEGRAAEALNLAKDNGTLFQARSLEETKDLIIKHWSGFRIDKHPFRIFPDEANAKRTTTRWGGGGLSRPERHLILTGSENDAVDLNCRAQAERILAGKLSSEKIRIGEYFIYQGDRIQFAERSTAFGIDVGAFGTVLKVNDNYLKTRLDDGRKLVLPLRGYDPANIHLGYAVPMSRAQDVTTRYGYVLIDPVLQDRQNSSLQASIATASARFYVDADTAGENFSNAARLMSRQITADLANTVREETLREEALQNEQTHRRENVIHL